MVYNKKLLAFGLLSGLLSLAWMAGDQQISGDRNLKVLPTDISDKKLDSIMHAYNIALGVDCKFCHVPLLNIPDSLDYASDKEPMKENARNMMRMMIHVNKTWFYFDKNQQAEYLNTVHCNTCHRGEIIPLD
jgi:hypothetical protein